MRKSIILIAAAGAIGIAVPATAQIASHQMSQQQRIRQGVRSGRLTPAETRRLEFLEARVRRTEARMRMRNGGHLTRYERRRLMAMQRRDSAEIYRLKHNRRVG